MALDNVEENENVEAVMTGDNSMTNKRHKVNQIYDSRVLDEVNTSIDFYKKVTDPHVSDVIKRRLFDRLIRKFAEMT